MFFEAFLLRLVLWVCSPLVLVTLAVGPGRIRSWWQRSWRWLTERRQDPEEILAQVVQEHQQHIQRLRKALLQAENAERDIIRNIRKSEESIPILDQEAQSAIGKNDDLGARAALYKLNLERAAVTTFKEHLERQRQHITESRRRLYLLELQLRQFEVGRSILLSQLAEAKTVEQQYAIANRFDPFSAVANWERAEGMVQEKAINARAAERVHKDTMDWRPDANSSVDPVLLEAQLAELKAKIAGKNPRRENRESAEITVIDHHPEKQAEKPRPMQTEG